jgi:high frequency lysogenization protein
MASTHNQVLALAAVLQSAYLVDEVARTGNCPIEHANPLLQSLFEFDPKTAESIYGGSHNLWQGFKILADLLDGNHQGRYQPVLRYALGILQLQQQAAKEPEMFDIIHNRLQHSAMKVEHFSNGNSDIAHSLAAIYQDTVSTMNFRLHIKGNAQVLQQSRNAEMIRSLLLAGIRAAMLWRQVGGRKWQLFFSRKRLRQAVKDWQEH